MGLIPCNSGLCSCPEALAGNRANEKADEPPCPHYASVHAWDADKGGLEGLDGGGMVDKSISTC
jgi:hypothetical protein